jgi:hypothetical protein
MNNAYEDFEKICTEILLADYKLPTQKQVLIKPKKPWELLNKTAYKSKKH